MSLSWDSFVKPRLTTLTNSHKIVRARQSTFTPTCLQRLKAYHETPAAHVEANEFLLLPTEILLPDFVCEIRQGPLGEPRRGALLILADGFLLVAQTEPASGASASAAVASAAAASSVSISISSVGPTTAAVSSCSSELLDKWAARGIGRSEWQAVAPNLSPQLTVCLHRFTLELISGFSILLVAPYLTLEVTPADYSPQSLFELLCAHRDLDISCLFLNLPGDLKPNYLGLESPRHVSQASLLSQVPLSSSPCSTKFFKKKFDSLWGYFSIRAPINENSKMFYGAIANPDLEGNLQVTRKAKSKRQKLWTVLKGQTVYIFKKRSSACNAEYEVNLESLSQLEIQDEPAKEQSKREQQLASAMSMSGGGIKTLALRFANCKKSVYLTPLDRFDFKRWEEALRRAMAGEKRPDRERCLEGGSSLQARRISGLSNSFHNLSSANNSGQESPTSYARKEGKLGLGINRGSREMMASCTNLDDMGAIPSSPVRSPKYSGALMAAASAAGPSRPAPIITVNSCVEDTDAENDLDDDGGYRRSSIESMDQLTPEAIAELKRRRISTQIQLDSLRSEVKKRASCLTPQQIQNLNSQMSDLYEELRDMEVTIARIDRGDRGSGRKKKGSF